IRFPSLPFFEALREEMRAARERFSRLGFFDTTFAVRVLDEEGAPLFEGVLGFEVFDCRIVREGLDGITPDFILEGPLPAWRESLPPVHRLGAGDTAHSINTLTHSGEVLQVRYDDPDGHDKLYRFAESIQEYFDLSAGLDFVYPDGAVPPPRAEEPASRESPMSYLSTIDFADDRSCLDGFAGRLQGDLDLAWLDEPRERVQCRAQNERRGLTFRDLDVGSYGYSAMPEVIRKNRSFAPRGAAQPEGLPDLQADVNRKSEVWAYNLEGYYEEAMTRQWNATTDIPWGDLLATELPADIGKAYAQLLTFLTEVEMIATDVPAKWMGRLNADFFEVKNFIATQAMDEARHAEIFRKRALSTGF